MRKNIDYYYKSFDGNNLSELERKQNECFNDYGFNLESNRRRTISIDELSAKSGPNCLNRQSKSKKK